MRFPCVGRVRLAAFVGFVGLSLWVVAPAAAADPPANPECWGVVTSQRASTEQDVGEHSSSQSEPRLGIGNVANLLTGSYQPGELGSLLASLDDLSATSCP
jgi:hypothetical protein